MKRSQSVLLVDLGNTRLKWQLITGQEVKAFGHVLASSVEELLRHPSATDDLDCCLASLGPSLRVVGGSVGAPEVKAWFVDWLDQRHHRQVEWVTSRASLVIKLPKGTICLDQPYVQPSRLGVDRWLAALGWLSLVVQQGATPRTGLATGEVSRLALVSAGTATVVDGLTLSGQGSEIRAQMVGGLIYPGFGLMRSALADQTADLGTYVAAGAAARLAAEPAVDSVSAICSGIAAAQVGTLGWLGPIDRVIVHGGYATDWLEAFDVWSAAHQPTAASSPQATEVQGLVFKGLAMLAEFA